MLWYQLNFLDGFLHVTLYRALAILELSRNVTVYHMKHFVFKKKINAFHKISNTYKLNHRDILVGLRY